MLRSAATGRFEQLRRATRNRDPPGCCAEGRRPTCLPFRVAERNPSAWGRDIRPELASAFHAAAAKLERVSECV